MLGFTRGEFEAGLLDARQRVPLKPAEREYLRKDGTRVAVLVESAVFGEAGESRVLNVVSEQTGDPVTNVPEFARMFARELARAQPFDGRFQEISDAAMRAVALVWRAPDAPILRLDEAISDSREFLRGMLPANIGITVSLASGSHLICACPRQIARILENLAIQARKAMPQGGAFCIETFPLLVGSEFETLYSPAPAGQYVQLIVSDSGSGAAEAQDELAAIEASVKKCRGSILVHRAPGFGTTFRILFPALEGQDQVAEPAPAARGGTETILLVEDEPGVRKYVNQILRAQGYAVLQAGDAEEAFSLAASHKGAIDLLLTDLALPGLTGGDISRRVNSLRPGIPVLVMSGSTERQRDPAEKSIPFIPKPFTPAELLGEIRTLLDSQNAAASTGLSSGAPGD